MKTKTFPDDYVITIFPNDGPGSSTLQISTAEHVLALLGPKPRHLWTVKRLGRDLTIEEITSLAIADGMPANPRDRVPFDFQAALVARNEREA